MNIKNSTKLILMGFCYLLYSPISYSEQLDMPNSLLHLNAMIGTGSLKQAVPKGTSTTSASLIKLHNFTIKGETVCQALSLKTKIKEIVVVAQCASGHFYICPNGKKSCTSEPFDPTIKKGKNRLEMHSKLFNTNYVVEFSPNRFIYRIQEKSCLVKYPHGCLIHGFRWKDEYTYEFSKH